MTSTKGAESVRLSKDGVQRRARRGKWGGGGWAEAVAEAVE